METIVFKVIATTVFLFLAYNPNGAFADFPNQNFYPLHVQEQQGWNYFQPGTYLTKRQVPPQQPRPLPFLFNNPFIPAGVSDQERVRRQPEQQPAQLQEPNMRQPLILPEVPRFRRSPLRHYGKKHPPQLGRACCLNADYCVTWLCPPPRSTWKKIQTQRHSNATNDESRARGPVSGCICNDLQFCPPGCSYEPTNFDHGKIGTRPRTGT